MYTYIVNICTYNDTYVNLWMITKNQTSANLPSTVGKK